MSKRPYLQHYIFELFSVDRGILANAESLKAHAKEFIKEMNLTFVKETHHGFDPRGSTLVFVLSKSHMSLHSWPENNYLHIDLLVCQELPKLSTLRKIVKGVFKARNYVIYRIDYNSHPTAKVLSAKTRIYEEN